MRPLVSVKLLILTPIPSKMNAVSVPSPSHFVKHLTTLLHTSTLSQNFAQFAHCVMLDNTQAQCGNMHITAKHQAQTSQSFTLCETLEDTCWHTRKPLQHFAHLHTLRDTGKGRVALLGQKILYLCYTPKLHPRSFSSWILYPTCHWTVHCIALYIVLMKR